jgi:DNA-binding NtrC family response regulator
MAQVILIIHESLNQANEIRQYIQHEIGLDSLHAMTGDEALRAMVKGTIPQPDVVLYHMQDIAYGNDAIRAMHSFRNDVQIITIFDHMHVEDAVATIDYGASDFLLMPFHSAQLTLALRNALQRRNLQIEMRHAWLGERFSLEEIHAESAALKATLFLAKSLAEGNAPLVLEGAPGTGREMLARAIHGSSLHKQAPFVSVNAALLLPNEVHHNLFGNEQRQGALAIAGKGTLFIRNIHCLPDSTLQKLLRVVKGGAPIYEGCPDEYFEGRLMFAMNDAARRSSSKEKKEINTFFSAINALPVALPYLREIPDDIANLAMLHCRRYSACEGKSIIGISAEASQMLREISWPGNIEQLAQAVFNAVMCCQGDKLQIEDFRYLFKPHSAEITYLMQPQDQADVELAEHNFIDGVLKCVDEAGNVKRLQDIEEEIIRYALTRYSGHMSDVARHLGIGRSTLYRKMSSMDADADAIIPVRTRRHDQ